MHIVHVLNQYSITASAIDQIQYILRDDIHSVSLVVGPSLTDEVPKDVIKFFNIKVLKNDIFSIKGFFEFAKIIKNLNPDVIHSHHAKSGFISSIISKFFNIKSLIEDGAKRDNYKLLTRLLFTLAEVLSNKVVFVSKSVEGSLSAIERHLISKNKSHVIHYGIDVPNVSDKDRQKFREKFSLSKGDVIMSHTGRFIPVKKQDEIIRLFAQIEKIDKMKLVLAGDGPLRVELEHLVCKLQIQDKVIFCGMLERNDVYALLSISKYFIMLSKTEGHSVSLLESMRYGCIPLLSEIDSFREMVNDDLSVFLSDNSGNANISKILSRMKAVSSKEIIEYSYNNYRSKKMMHKYYELYESTS